MSVPKVNLRKIDRQISSTFFLDYTINSKRIRQAVGSSRSDAEVLRAKGQSDLTLGFFDPYLQTRKQIDLDSLSKDFIASKRNFIRNNSLRRYENYLKVFHDYFKILFPASCHDVRNIKDIYVRSVLTTYSIIIEMKLRGPNRQ